MTNLADVSDEALEAEVERRKRRKDSAENDRVLREFIHSICLDGRDGLNKTVTANVKSSLGKADFELFLLQPEKFIFSITGSYIGSR